MIWEVRQQKKISMPELAKRTGLSRSALYNYESESVSPTLEKLHMIAQALGVRMQDLYEE